MLHLIRRAGVCAALAAVSLGLSAACGGSDSSTSFPDGGAASAGFGAFGGTAGSTGGTAGTAGTGGTAGSTGGTAGTGGAGGCTSATQCDDGIACTTDYCVGGSCSHAPGPNSGATACPAGQYCDAKTGCVPSPACASTEQCEQQFGSDACKVEISCDPASATCKFELLDKDEDGHPPIVCGGDDCDDADELKYPTLSETCDGKDNDCDGTADNGAPCPSGGTCQCGGICVDLASSAEHCGACNKKCPTGASCVQSSCVCPSGTTDCGSACADTQTNAEHCGACNKKCPTGASCNNGKCGSPVMMLLVDHSGSMGAGMAGGTRWSELQSAVVGFLQDPATAGLFVGLQYLPLATNISSCSVSDFATPAEPFGLVPGTTSTNIINSVMAQQATGGSPIVPALEGSLAAAASFTSPDAGAKRAVVMLTDGSPTACTTQFSAITAAAQAGAAGTPSVSTYVVAIATTEPAAQWDQVAAAGGTGTSYQTGTTGHAAIISALLDIRQKLTGP